MSVKFIKSSYPLGFSDLLPEGICGLIDEFTLPPISLKRPPKVRLKHKPLKGLKALKSQEPFVVQPRYDTLRITRKEKIDERGRGRNDKGKPNTITDMNINYGNLSVDPKFSDLETTNTVEVAESLLQRIARTTESRTKQLGKLLLANVAPSILAHQAALNYVGAVMQDSFDIELEEDVSIGEALRDITKIEVLEYFTKKLKVPEHRKEAIMSAFVDKITTGTVARMENMLKQGRQEGVAKTLEAVLSSRAKGSEPVVVRGKTPDPYSKERVLQRPMLSVPKHNQKRHIGI